jgi:hypothetical protein
MPPGPPITRCASTPSDWADSPKRRTTRVAAARLGDVRIGTWGSVVGVPSGRGMVVKWRLVVRRV